MQSVLICDDSESIREILAAICARQGLDVKEASTGESCIRKFSSKMNLVILDLGLPDISGLDVLRRIKNIHADVPVLIVTGDTSMRSAVEAMRKGAHNYISKPIVPEKIEAAPKSKPRMLSVVPNVASKEFAPTM